MTIRMHPSPLVVYQALTANGRAYSGTPGTTQDVLDADAAILEANGWARAFEVGPTAQRPVAPTRGRFFHDTTVAAVIIYDGATWRNAITGASV